MANQSSSPFVFVYNPVLNYLAKFLVVLTLFLLFAGAMVTSTNSGLSVPDWPSTYNYNMFLFPPSMMVGGIFYEHGHRLIASFTGLVTLLLSASLFSAGRVSGLRFLGPVEPRLWVRMLGLAAVVLVILQGILGGLTVLYKLPMFISVAHGASAELFLLLITLIAFVTSPIWAALTQISFSDLHLLRLRISLMWSLLFCIGIFFQILAGAVLRHSALGLAIPTFPFAFGHWLPPFWNFGIWLHFMHSRVGATFLLLLGLGLALRLRVYHANIPATPLHSLVLPLLLILQIFLGMLTIWTGKLPIPTSFHVIFGALTFLFSFTTFLALARSLHSAR